MIVGGPKNGKFIFEIYDANNNLFATVESYDHQEGVKTAEDIQRKALAPIMAGHKMSVTDWNDPLLDAISDDELLSELFS